MNQKLQILYQKAFEYHTDACEVEKLAGCMRVVSRTGIL